MAVFSTPVVLKKSASKPVAVLAVLGQASHSRMWLWLVLVIGLAMSFLPGVRMAGHVGGLIGGPLLPIIAKVRKMPNHTMDPNRLRLHDAVICVYDDAGNVIEIHEQADEFREW
jgi:hypothetical protein